MNRMTRVLGIASLVGLAGLGGCATVTTGHSQSIVVDSDPQGAECRLKRGEKDVGVVNPTPGSATVDKGFGKIDVRCAKPGFDETAEVLTPEFQAMTLGNVIIGGVIGILVDAASGAMAKYPNAVKVALFPAAFESGAARDAYFRDRRETVAKDAAAERERIGRGCTTEEACAQALKALDARTEGALAQLESRRERARIEERPPAQQVAQ